MSRLLFDSTHPLDKVVFMAEGSITLEDGKMFADKILHPETNKRILLMGQFSIDADFKNSYPFGTHVSFLRAQAGSPFPTVTGFALLSWWTPEGIVLRARDDHRTGRRQIFYKLFALPADESDEFPETQEQSGDFILNTNYNYLKLIDAGSIDTRENKSIYHGMKKIPFVLTWIEEIISTYDPVTFTPKEERRISRQSKDVYIMGGQKSDLVTVDEEYLHYEKGSQLSEHQTKGGRLYYRIYDV